jgi:hypothetical protein
MIIELNMMFSCMRGGHLSGVFCVAVVGDLVVMDVEGHERWSIL